MAEEHRCQPPLLCANNCGFFGSPTTHNLCSKCFRDLQLNPQQSSSAKFVFNQTLAPPLSSPAVSQPSPSSYTLEESIAADSSSSVAVDMPRAAVAQTNRCGNCRKRVGLTGLKCRYGLTLCGSHRYPENHGCEFDFKEMGREQIAKANPVVKGEKLRKI